MFFAGGHNERQALFRQWDEALRNKRVYGFAFSKTIFEETFLDFDLASRLAGVFDNNPRLEGATEGGLSILSPRQLRHFDGKILIFFWNAAEVARQLSAAGLRRYHDYWAYKDFLAFYHWYGRGRVFMPATDVLMTLNCTLSCIGCSMLIPELKKPGQVTLESLKSDLDMLFSVVDYQHRLYLIGGEPLLSPALPAYLEYLGRRYRSRIFKITIVTNGMVPPEAELLDICLKYGVEFSVSDYSQAEIPGYETRLSRTIKTLADHGLPHSLNRPAWNRHHCGEREMAALSDLELREHYLRCRELACRGLKDGRFYPCFKTWSAEAGGLTRNSPEDYIDLGDDGVGRELKKERLVDYILGGCDRGYLRHCRRCYGFDPDYYQPMPIAAQPGARSHKTLKA